MLVKKDRYVVQSNRLIEASYRLDATQHKFIRILASMVKPDDKDFKVYWFKIADLIKLYDVKDQSKYTEIPNKTKELMRNVIQIKERDKIYQFAWLCFCEHRIGEGMVGVKFAPELKSLYIGLNKEFTKYELRNIMKFQGTYSFRIYELLKQYENINGKHSNEWERTFELNDLKYKLAIGKDEYKRYSNFKARVLNTSKREICENTDIDVDYDEIRVGRKIGKIRFTAKVKEQICLPLEEHSEELLPSINEPSEEKTDLNEDENNIELEENEVAITGNEEIKDQTTITKDEIEKLVDEIRCFIKEPLSDSSIRTLLKAADKNVELIKEKYDIAKESVSEIENLGAWLNSAITENYKPNTAMVRKKRKKKNGFDNFKARDYTPEEIKKIEESLLKRSRENMGLDIKN